MTKNNMEENRNSTYGNYEKEKEKESDSGPDRSLKTDISSDVVIGMRMAPRGSSLNTWSPLGALFRKYSLDGGGVLGSVFFCLLIRI